MANFGPDEDVCCTFTDSGYASALGVTVPHHLPPEVTRNTNHEDDATIYTIDSSIGDSSKQTHIHELANEIYCQLHLNGNRQRWETISNRAPILLKTFTIRVGSFFGTPTGRGVMRFVHKHSR